MLCLTQKMEKPALKTPDLPETPAFEKPFVPRYRLLKDNKLRPTVCCSWQVLQP